MSCRWRPSEDCAVRLIGEDRSRRFADKLLTSCTNAPDFRSNPYPSEADVREPALMISRRRFFRFLAGLGAAGFSTAAYGVSEPVLRLGVTRYDIQPPHWPSDLELKVAALADVHACDPWMSLAHIEGIVERTNALQPDIIVMLGDY